MCLKYRNPNQQPDHSTFTIYHNTLVSVGFFDVINLDTIARWTPEMGQQRLMQLFLSRMMRW